MPAMESDGGRIYMSADYDICIQTLPGGDLQGTIAAVSGFSGADMTVMTTQDSGCRRHEFVWAAAGEPWRSRPADRRRSSEPAAMQVSSS